MLQRMAKLDMDGVLMLWPVVASQLQDDFDKHSKEEKAKVKNHIFFTSVKLS